MTLYTTKMFALVSLLALSAVAATATTCPQYFPLMMGMGAMDPCMQSCTMQQEFTMGGSPSPMMGMGATDPCMQSCMTQQAFTMGASPLLAMMMQQVPMRMLQQQCCMQGMMSPQCHCAGAMCQMMQQQQHMRMAMQMPYMRNTAAYYQQLIPGCAF